MTSLHSLREIPVFSGLNEDELGALAPLLRERKAPKGSYLVCHDDPGASILFLAQGKAKVTLVSTEGKEVVLYRLRKGDFFGELAVLTGEDRSANVVAVSDSLLLVLQGDDFKRHIEKHGGLALALMRELALRLRAASSKIGDLALLDVYRRVASTLRSLAVSGLRDGEEVLIIEDRPTHQEIANMVATSREMVTRALKNLEDDGCIETEGKSLLVYKMPI